MLETASPVGLAGGAGTVGCRWGYGRFPLVLRHSYQPLSFHMPFLLLWHPTGLVCYGKVRDEICKVDYVIYHTVGVTV